MNKRRACRCSSLAYVNTKILKQLLDAGVTSEGHAYLVTNAGTDFGHRFTWQDVSREYYKRINREYERGMEKREREERQYRRENPICRICSKAWDKRTDLKSNFTIKSWHKNRPRSRCKSCRAAFAKPIPF